jgi:NAD(P)-dependent dehydrogenase (short-subunit alcohol dehydrogenase family)
MLGDQLLLFLAQPAHHLRVLLQVDHHQRQRAAAGVVASQEQQQQVVLQLDVSEPATAAAAAAAAAGRNDVGDPCFITKLACWRVACSPDAGSMTLRTSTNPTCGTTTGPTGHGMQKPICSQTRPHA